MQIVVEVHQFAPELNKVHVIHRNRHVGTLGAPHVESIRQARATLFDKPKFTIMAVVEKQYKDAKHRWLDRRYVGSVSTRAQVLGSLRHLREGVLPGVEVSVTARTYTTF